MKTCSHCQLPYKESALTKVFYNNQELYFCCKGCEGVYMLLHQNHLESFYDKLHNQTIKPPKNLSLDDLKSFDSPSFLQKYAFKDSQNLWHIALVIDGIHCSACTWLIESMLCKQEGIYEASMNYTNNKIKILFDVEILPLSHIISIIRSLGYDAHIYDPKLSEENFLKQNKKYYIAMIVAIFCTMNIMWIAVGQYAGYFLGMSQEMKDVLNLVAFLLATPVLFFTGSFFYLNAFKQLKKGIVSMDLLVSTGAMLTYFYSLYTAISQNGETYFESVSMIITFVFIGKFLEIKAKKNAGDNLDSLGFLLPTQVTLIKDNKKIICSPQEVPIDSLIEVAPNEVLAIDGILVSKEALLDMQNISGESLPVLKSKGEALASGSINTQGILHYKTTTLFYDSLLFKLIDILEHSLSQKPQIQNLANALSQYFSRAVLLIAILGFLVWYFILPHSFEYALMIAISVIVISCPCALALATPIASVIGINEAYKQKIIFKESRFLESIAKANHIIFDKTGTLTLGKPQVLKQQLFADFDTALLTSLLSYSKHPIAQSIKDYHQQESLLDIQDFKEILGRGILGKYKDKNLIGGSLLFLKDNAIDIKHFDLQNYIAFGFAINKQLCAIYLLEDSLKTNAKTNLAHIATLIPRITLLSGDHQKSVAYIANALNIQDFYANLLPQQKAQYIEECQKNGEITIMVGDGINDTLALSKSDIGIAFSTQNNITSLASDIILLDQNLQNLQNTLQIAHKTYKTIKQNICISIVYNAIMIPLALCGFIIPLFAALSMSVSSLLVIANSLRIKKWQNPQPQPTNSPPPLKR